MEPTVSIIVPVYNAEATLPRCVESILTQEFRDFELLLVDDGSSDGSGALCDGYAAGDSRVRVFHVPNGGVSAARNLGLDHARGEYLQFLDSDDWITQDATTLLIRAARDHGCDLVISDFYRVVGERVSHKGDIEEDTVLTREEYAAHMMERPADFYYGVLWNKLYRREIVERHHLRMNEEISWCEDFMFNLEYIRWAERFYAMQVPVYYYVKTKGSLASQYMSIPKTIRMKLLVFEYYNRFYKTVLDEEEYERSRLKVYKFLVDAAGDGMVLPAILPGTTKLGSERVQVARPALDSSGVLADAFRERKLLDACLEPTALRYDLTLGEARLLLQLSQTAWEGTRKDLAEMVGVSRRGLTVALQRLTARELVETWETWPYPGEKGERRWHLACSAGARGLLADLTLAWGDYEQARTGTLTGEELAHYNALSDKVRSSVRDALR